ncbi:MarR family transcriptional regulator [Priestia megaterium]|uniref:MarR family transcriptional regulator n=1 Tax=Priestia megaterium TaxID=1404 RepID=UPI002041C322|nr:MarR family transcriptional regulator [Priestia megaterium]MCM3546909.1 MarR family transcriptional regulator [Priestia megaterium]
MKKALDQAEKNARIRDSKIEEIIGEAEVGLSAEQQKMLLQILHKTTGDDYFIAKKRKKNDGVKFVQIITENLNYLCEVGYLTSAEKAFLLDISRYLEIKSNVIIEKAEVEYEEIKVNAATPTYLAKALGKSRAPLSVIMNDLLKKGILGVAEAGITTEEGRNCTSRTWFVNPNILCCGPKDNIDRATQQIFRRSLKNFTVGDTKKKHNLPIYLF